MKTFYIAICVTALFTIVTENEFADRLSNAAILLTKDDVTYDPTYYNIAFPNGDVPKNKGVCTDVVIRAYRKLGVDLQKEINTDMKLHFPLYPKIWGLSRPDSNIDHRRVPNMQIFFSRHGKKLPVSKIAGDYQTGDLVTWLVGGKLPHIGIVTSRLSTDGKRRLIVHNIGAGQVLEDCLFAYTVTGHYRYHK